MTNDTSTQGTVESWFHGRLPDAWFIEPARVSVDREEILVVGRIEPPAAEEGSDDEHLGAAAEGRISRFREDTRGQRMGIANQAEERFGRKVSWGVSCGEVSVLFTHVAAPVMTRLRQPERAVLDTLVEAGVAKSRSDAVAWCVRLVGEHEGDWIAELHDALSAVRETRAKGPGSRRTA